MTTTEGLPMTNETASRHNTTKVSKSQAVFILTSDGRLLNSWRQNGNTIIWTDAYGGTLAQFTLGVDCAKVVRNRVTTVTETYEVA
jgi:hypothetical protein